MGPAGSGSRTEVQNDMTSIHRIAVLPRFPRTLLWALLLALSLGATTPRLVSAEDEPPKKDTGWQPPSTQN